MRYNLVPVRSTYRGMGRSLLATDLYSRNKRKYNELLELYYDYIVFMEQGYSESNFEKLISFFRTLVRSGVVCEIIVYDYCPLITAYGYNLEFLGIDIVCDMAESLLCGCAEYVKRQLLNKHGLCASLSNVEPVMRFLNQGNVRWEPCYVYKVSVGDGYSTGDGFV